MCKNRMRYCICLLVIASFVISTVEADQNEQKRRPQQSSLLAGGGMVIKDEPLKGIRTEIFPIPFYLYQGKAFSIRGLSASYEIFAEEQWTISGLARLRTDGYDADDSSDLDGMSDRRNSLDVGAELQIENSWGNVGLDWLTDALGNHDGHETRLTFVKSFRAAFGIKNMGLRPMLGLSWRSSNLNNYYYGVRAKEASANRNPYKCGSSMNPFAGIVLEYQLSERWGMFSMFKNEWLASEITNSPIIDQNNMITVILGLLYRF